MSYDAVSYDAAAAALSGATSIIITTHINPDGDGIGSGLALLLALDRPGRRVRFLCPSRVASLYAFLPRFAELTPVTDDAQAAEAEACEVMISCDAGDRERLGSVAKVRHTTLINLDHHVTNTRFGNINLVDETAESSGVVVEGLLRRLGVAVDRTIAECLYTTIVFDTGRFMHSNTTAHTFRWTADLLETGIDASEINRRLTYTRSPKDLAILKLGIECLAIDDDPRLAGIVIPAASIAAVGEPEDWGDLVEIPRSLAGNRVAYLMRESKDGKSVRVSLRSNPPIEIGSVAQAFGGGGHAFAAGCTVVKPLAEAVADVRARLRRQLGQ
ncbi:MAG: DHH family phosphoesterase [Planctomycetes bacterium]|nr:DHH family phosphoesterase [Planctomycetota bacterium]